MTPPSNPSPSAPIPSRPIHTLAVFTLLGLLLLLALRLTMIESFHQTIAQAASQFRTQLIPEIGPAVTFGLSALTIIFAGIAALCAWRTNALPLSRLLQFLLLAAIISIALDSTFGAANRFVALVGLADLSMALLAGWSVALLCHPNLLGTRGQKIAAAALISLLAVTIAKGYYQRFIDIPQTISDYKLDKAKYISDALGPALATRPADPAVKLFEARIYSSEVTAFLSSSNSTATALVGLLALLTGLVMQSRSHFRKHDDDGSEIPFPMLLTYIAAGLALLGTILLLLTLSRGGSAAGLLCILAITACALCWRQVLNHRRKLFALTVFALALAAVAVIAFGISRDALPTKSLMFRWHYWTASIPIIEQHPTLGVGLNNFGDYYTVFKRASSPEEVKDPHSFFIRLAAEIGLPATCLIALLIFWIAARTWHRRPADVPPSVSPPLTTNTLPTAITFSLLWWTAHMLLAEPLNLYTLEMSAIYALIAAAAWMLAASLLDLLDTRGLHFLTIASLLGALAMLLYDQINLALVTGPVAMLFWIMLGLADSDSPVPSRPSFITRAATILPALACTLAGALLATQAWYPTLTNTMPWDPNPYITQYIRAMNPSSPLLDSYTPPKYPAAKTALEAALIRAPRSVELHQQLLLILEQLHQPSHQEIDAILQLNHTNPRIRMSLGLNAADLSPTQRLDLLQQALTFNAQLPQDELTRLNDHELAQIQTKINELKMTTPAQTPSPKP